MEPKREGQNSLGSTIGEDIYKIRPSKRKDGVVLISDRFRYGPICYYRTQHDRVRQIPLSVTFAPSHDPRVGRLRRCNPDAHSKAIHSIISIFIIGLRNGCEAKFTPVQSIEKR